MKTLNALRLAAASVLALGVVNAYAGTETADMQVTAEVVANCTISVTDLAFGAYDPIVENKSTGVHVENASTITTTCTKAAPIFVAIDNGDNANATTYLRNMHNGASNLGYELYSDSAYASTWATVNAVGTGAAVVTDVYGRIPKGQDATTLEVGNYSDILTVSVTF